MTPPPTEYSSVRLSAPFSMIDALAVVPPMSNEIALSMPILTGRRLDRDNSRGRPRFDNVHRSHGSGLGGRQAAVRLHQQKRGVDPDAREFGGQGRQVFFDDRPDISIDDGGRVRSYSLI